MARNLARAGHAVHVFDVDPAAIERLAPSLVTAHRSPRELAARVPVVFTALPNNAIVTETYLGPAGILAGAQPGTITCDCSTVSPEVSQRIQADAKAKGVTHLDTPMLGSSPQAESGEVFFMVGGDPEALRRVQAMLDVMGRLTMHVGPSGMGNRIKLLHNALGAVTAVAVVLLAIPLAVVIQRRQADQDRRELTGTAAQAADRGEQHCLGEELHADVRPGGAERPAQADLGSALKHRDDHDVRDADARLSTASGG